jgi:hypothetical protein
MVTKSEPKTKKVKLPSEIFSQEFNPALVHQALTSYLSSKRQGSVLLKIGLMLEVEERSLSNKKVQVEQELEQ